MVVTEPERVGPLAGLQVVELAGGSAVAYCGRLLASCGATVIRVEPPQGDALRWMGPFPGDIPTVDGGAMHSVLNTGKQSVALDVTTATGVALAEPLIAGSDLLLTSWRTATKLPLAEPQEIASAFPRTLYLTVSDFGMHGPYSPYRADSHVLEALTGMSYVTGAPDREPLSIGVELSDYVSGVHAFTAALAALLSRTAGSSTQHIDVSAFESMCMMDDYNLSLFAGTGAIRRRFHSRVLIAYPSDIMACGQGYVGFVPGGRDFAEAVATLIGRPELATHPLFLSARERLLHSDDFDALVQPWLQDHTAEDVLQQAHALGLAFAAVVDVKQLTDDEHLRERGFFERLTDGTQVPGPPFRMSRTPIVSGAPPTLGAANEDMLGVSPAENVSLWRSAFEGMTGRRHAIAPQTDIDAPSGAAFSPFFDKLRVVDLSHVWVGPLVTRVLADLGAEIIKVERADRPDVTRASFPSGNDTSGDFWNRSPYFAVRQAGKRSIVLDLRRDEGKMLLRRLLVNADVLVENFPPRVLRSFGLDYQSLREEFPRLVVVSICGYGQDGPKSNVGAVGMSMEPGAGISSVTGYADGPPAKTGNTWVDPFVGLHATGALFAALLERETSGRGQHIDVSMQEVTMQVLGPQLRDYSLNHRVPPRLGNRRPGMVRGTYPCLGTDEWVAISIGTDDEWSAFCSASGQSTLLHDRRFADAVGRSRHHDEIDRLISEWTMTHTKFDAMRTLQMSGVPAGALLRADEILRDPQLRARRFFRPVEVPGYGTIPVQRYLPALFDGNAYGPRGRPPVLGEHTDEIIDELGIDETTASQLHEDGVVEPVVDHWAAEATRVAMTMPLEEFVQIGSLFGIDQDHRATELAAYGVE